MQLGSKMAVKIPVTDRVLRSGAKQLAAPKVTALVKPKATPKPKAAPNFKAAPKPKAAPKAKVTPKAKATPRPKATKGKVTKAEAARKAKQRAWSRSTGGLAKLDFSPARGSEAALQSRANSDALEILSAMYFDINSLCSLQRIVQTENDFAVITPWQNQINEAKASVHLEVLNYVEKYEMLENSPADEEHGINRLYQFVEAYGWRLLSICLHAESFRRAFRNIKDRVWNTLFSFIGENQLSLEVFAISRQLQWRDALEYVRVTIKKLNGLPSLMEALSEQPNWGFQITHPHDVAITLNGEVQNTYFKGKPRTVIYESFWDSAKWGSPDPTLRTLLTNVVECIFCLSKEPCACRLVPLAGGMVELREYPLKGIGVRALANFKRDDILAVFVGEIYPCKKICDDDPDQAYALTQFPNERDPGVAEILPHFKGNWTRFINHSCQPSTCFMTRHVGDRVVTTVEAIRHISAFEELTINYGDSYWVGEDRVCQCKHWNCISRGLK
jgi:hypothetical protein